MLHCCTIMNILNEMLGQYQSEMFHNILQLFYCLMINYCHSLIQLISKVVLGVQSLELDQPFSCACLQVDELKYKLLCWI